MTTTEQLVIVEQLVLQERKIVTYGWLSRHLNIHANKAKQLLYEFISEYKPSKENNVHAVYCICGLTTDNKQHTVTLVTQEKLEAARKGFIRLTSLHVYSVQPVCPTESELIKAGRDPINKAANESVLNTNKDATSVTSTLVSQSIDVKESSIKPKKVDEKKLAKSELTSSEKSTPITVAIKDTFSQASDKTSDVDSPSNRTTSQDESEASNKKEKKRKSIEVESNHSEDFDGSKKEQTNKKSKKQITAKQKDDKINDITSLLNKVAFHNELKTSNKQSKKRKSDEAINELDFEISEEGKANKKKNGKESLQNNDDNSQNKATTKDKVVKKRKNNKVTDDLNQQEVEASKINERKDGIASFLNKVDKTEQRSEISDKLDKLNINNDKKDKDKLSVALVQNTTLTVQQKKRGRRQVLKSRSYVNERGYTVHENYHEWESFSEGESVSEKKPQKVIKAEELNITAKRGKKKKGDNGSQKSLLNFFGKK